MVLKDLILSQLRQQKIKLWLPPYHTSSPCEETLRSLASSLSTQIQDGNETLDQDRIYNALLELQAPAVDKYVMKHSVDFKIVGVLADKDVEISSDISSAWGDSVSIQKNNGKLMIRLVNISASLTVQTLLKDLSSLFNGGVRLIYRGANLSSGYMKVLIGRDTGTKILCLVSPAADVGSKMGSVSTSQSATANIEMIKADSTIIESIRQAAHTLQNSSMTQFEITDQSGQLVPMSQTDSTSFLTALGLHRLGRSKMEADKKVHGSDNKQDVVSKQSIASALTFLLEADREWNSSPALSSWMGKVDNYGLLQLDIAWCYLLLGSLENLPDAVERLANAESVLRKQVHSNFVTLALAQADMGNPIPPLCSVFVRLFLLQGVAYKALNSNTEAAKRLGWARLLCQRLRASSPSDAVDELCKVYSTTDRSVAIAALRRSNGNPDDAGNAIAASREEEKAALKNRRRQRKLGRCANGSDWVNIGLISALASMLGMNVDTSDLDTEEDDDRKLSIGVSVTTGLLRLTNNNIEESIKLYGQIGADTVMQRADELDRSLGRKREEGNDQTETPNHKVQEMDLVTLMSMGVEESHARDALTATGNVDAAIVWLSTFDGEASEAVGEIAADSRMGSTDEESESEPHESDFSDAMAEAQDLLQSVLGTALGSSKNLEKEWLGVDLKDEWEMIEQYCTTNKYK